MEQNKSKSLPFAAGLAVGAAAAAGAAFLYKTKKGRKMRKILTGYYQEAKEQIGEVVEKAKNEPEIKKLTKEVKQEAKLVRKKLNTLKKKVFHHSGKPLVK